jgi:N6-adenosine-specific RNA methylase IME4
MELMNEYKTVYADPPWFENGGGKIIRGANAHYPLMKTIEIIKLKDFVNSISEENCHLYLWVTNNFLEDGLTVMKEWGFKYKNKVEWLKGDPETNCFEKFGLGQYFRGITETCLFGVKGCLPYKIIDGKRQQGKTAFFAKRGEHSEKPEKMRRIIETISYPAYIELFARKQSAGWDVWGNEV